MIDPTLPVSVHLLPALIPPGALRGGLAVVVDVLRATTVMAHALDSGCAAIIPCAEVDEARRVVAGFPPGAAISGGERQGLPIEGFDLGNSPASYTPEVCRGKTLVMTTTNGTRAILASLEADRVLIGAFVNLKATFKRAASDPRPVHVVCAGTNGLISFEDALFAGALVDGLLGSGREPGNDQALIVSSLWADGRRCHLEGKDLRRRLAEGWGGHRVHELGLDGDLDAAASVDRLDLAAELRRDPVRIVRAD